MTRQPKESDGKLNIPQGTLDLMILTIVPREPLHGYGIAQRLKTLTQGTFQINPGLLFPLSTHSSATASCAAKNARATTIARRATTRSPHSDARSWSRPRSAGSE